MVDYVKKSMSSIWTRFRGPEGESLLCHHPGRAVMPAN
jgi:hypothetical protein